MWLRQKAFPGFLAMLMRLFAPQFLVVWAFLGSAVAVHFRGKVRLGSSQELDLGHPLHTR
jgi:hypothetical protein